MIKKIKETYEKYKDKLSSFLKILKIPNFAVIIGFLGAYGGSEGTSLLWRRVGIAVLSTIYAYYKVAKTVGVLQALWVLTVMSLWGALAIGYGIPDDDYPENENADSGSTVGNFYTMLFRRFKNRLDAHLWGDYMTRGTVGCLKAISFLSVPILLGNWVIYGASALGFIISDALIGWRPWGDFKKVVFGKEIQFNWADVVNYTLDGVFIYVLISFKLL